MLNPALTGRDLTGFSVIINAYDSMVLISKSINSIWWLVSIGDETSRTSKYDEFYDIVSRGDMAVFA